ncbi:MAG: hypothetical protein AB1556_03845 [Bacillota bacterium]
MFITKKQVFDIIKEFPEQIDIEELMYRLYLKHKLDIAEEEIKKGNLLTHEEVIKETSQWFK